MQMVAKSNITNFIRMEQSHLTLYNSIKDSYEFCLVQKIVIILLLFIVTVFPNILEFNFRCIPRNTSLKYILSSLTILSGFIIGICVSNDVNYVVFLDYLYILYFQNQGKSFVKFLTRKIIT